MKKSLQLVLSDKEAFDENTFSSVLKKRAGISIEQPFQYRITKRSIDARSKRPKINVAVEAFSGEEPPALLTHEFNYQHVGQSDPVIIVGMGPAGMFAALQLIEAGLKPIIIERGKNVRDRRRDLAAINKDHIVNPDSNYCFGEGGAGTYSDGKLYTRSKKRGDLRRILEILVYHGATDKILYEAHPHIGTNKLPKVVQAMRQTILDCGGEILFNTRVTDLLIHKDEIQGVVTQDGENIKGLGVILATGHSARDIFELLHRKEIAIEAKNFALGVRVEHQQQLIDKIQYHCDHRGQWLPASPYALSHQARQSGHNRGVFSFCMCPGGFIVPAATAPGEIVVNGMSPSRRDSKFANSGIVTEIRQEDLKGFEKHGPLAAMYFQQHIEQQAFALGAKSQTAPAQRLVDFVEGKVSADLLPTSYQPGLLSMSLNEILPDFVADALRQGFKAFGKKMRGYYTNDAQVVGVESRTSSPVSIPRTRETGEHIQIKGLYPCGEGAGYAGGIVSAAMDGVFCASSVAKKHNPKSERA